MLFQIEGQGSSLTKVILIYFSHPTKIITLHQNLKPKHIHKYIEDIHIHRASKISEFDIKTCHKGEIGTERENGNYIKRENMRKWELNTVKEKGNK